MHLEVTSKQIAKEVAILIAQCASQLRLDIADGLSRACASERSEVGRYVLSQLIENAEIARCDDVPLCQDTGTAFVSVTIFGRTVITGSLTRDIDDALARTYQTQGLRASVVKDALLCRENTGDNTPAFIEISYADASCETQCGVRLAVMLKGAGSDNASAVLMLNPHDGYQRIEEELCCLVREKASMACPPLIIGIGVGGTFDTVGMLSKKALMRDISAENENPEIARIEKRLLAAVNSTGMGPGGLGGDTTALAVMIKSAPCHIAAMPVAINLGCCALRWQESFIQAAEGK